VAAPLDWIDRARLVMDEREITQQDIADALGVTRGAVGHWLCGRREPTLSQFLELSDALDVSAGWLLAGEQ
tara:strand:- start:216 stop:428 length:213 start_codon:yes stop_codon:yes gene_type:complete